MLLALKAFMWSAKKQRHDKTSGTTKVDPLASQLLVCIFNEI